MLGHGLMQGLVGFYVLLVVVFLYEGNLHKALYWFGASCITFSVLTMR